MAKYPKFILGWAIFLLPNLLASQIQFEWNVYGDFELSKAGSRSHFYYNEIDTFHSDWRVSVAQFNFLSKISFSSEWSLNSRFLLRRDHGRALEDFVIPLLNVQWVPEEKNFGLTIGRFINPFGAFNDKQLFVDRTFISRPLSYGYYLNVSDQFGFVEGLADLTRIRLDYGIDWGNTMLNYGGYATGIKFNWDIKPSILNVEVALVNGSSNVHEDFTEPLNWGIITRVGWQPYYFWKQGFSVNYGTFLKNSRYSDQLEDLRRYRQLILGWDYTLGFGYFEIFGEALLSFYKVPVFLPDTKTFAENTTLDLSSFSTFLDIKYSLPFLGGSFLAYRFETMTFEKLNEERFESTRWDNNIIRHSIALGYKVTSFLQIRGSISTQSVDDKRWDNHQRAFRLMLTLYY